MNQFYRFCVKKKNKKKPRADFRKDNQQLIILDEQLTDVRVSLLNFSSSLSSQGQNAEQN